MLVFLLYEGMVCVKFTNKHEVENGRGWRRRVRETQRNRVGPSKSKYEDSNVRQTIQTFTLKRKHRSVNIFDLVCSDLNSKDIYGEW